MASLVALVWIALFVGLLGTALLVREAALGALLVVGVVLLALTESLSALGALTPAGLAVGWTLALLLAILCLGARIRTGYERLLVRLRTRPSRSDALFLGVLGVLATGSLAAVLLYPPSNWDSLTYHLPRVFFWLQHASVEHYPAAEARQLFSSPFANYAVLHVQALTGGSDRFIGLPQWVSYLFVIVAVSLIAWRLGAAVRGQWIAALVAATIPMAVLQASSTQNDLMCAAWCLAAVYGILAMLVPSPEARTRVIPGSIWGAWIASAAALAFLTKPIALFALAPFGVWLLVSLARSKGVAAALRTAGLVLLGTAVLCVPWFARNAATLGGDPLGITAPGNTHLLTAARTPAGLATNSLMNLSMLVALPVHGANDPLERSVEAIGRSLGIAELESVMGEPAYGPYGMRHEVWSHDVAPAPITALMIAVSGASLALMRGGTSRPALPYLAASATGLLITVAALGWQPWVTRLALPSLLAMTPIVGIVLDRSRVTESAMRTVLSVLLIFSMMLGSLVMLFDVNYRLAPMPGSFWHASYDDLRYRVVPDLEPVLNSVLEYVEASDAYRVGIHQLEGDFPVYLLLASLRDREVSYVGNIVLEDRLPQTAEPQVIVALMQDHQYDGFRDSDPSREDRYLLPPRSTMGWTILLYAEE